MRKLWLLVLILILLVALAGCGEPAGDKPLADATDHYAEYNMSETEEDRGTCWYISGSAYVEQGLALVELANSWQEPVTVDMVLSFAQAGNGFTVYYVTETGEELLWLVGSDADVEAEGVYSLSWEQAVAPGKSWLELRPGENSEAGELAFSLDIANEGGKAFAAKMPGDLAEGLEEMAAGLPQI